LISIGGKSGLLRLIFDTNTDPAICGSMMDMGQRFHMVANTVDVVPAEAPLPKLPMVRAICLPRPDLKTAAKRLDLCRRHAQYPLQLCRYC
jgi:L-arabinose isomerase